MAVLGYFRYTDFERTAACLSSQGAVKSRGSAGFASFLVKNYPAISRNGLRITPELVNQPFT
jgi:hypothetical protein